MTIAILVTISCIAIIASGQGSSSSQSYSIGGGSITINNALNRALLNKHNSLRDTVARYGLSTGRDQPTASYMNALFYDPGLALLAQNYLNSQSSCYGVGHNSNRKSQFYSTFQSKAAFSYSEGDGIGENLMWSSAAWSDTTAQAVSQAETGWWDEYQWYYYSGEACYPPTSDDSCGHYTQMAWADTRYVGCGQRSCSDGSGIVTLCNYYPSGNMGSDFENNVYKQPYPSGTPCSTCSLMAPDRTTCNRYTYGQCYGCQATDSGSCSDCCDCSGVASSCPTETCASVGSLTANDPAYDGVLNSHLCWYCPETCGTCSSTDVTADACSNDGLAYGFSSFQQGGSSFTADDPETIKETANWAIAGMCIIFGVCSVILGVGYYCHHKKMDSMKLKLKANELMLTDKLNVEQDQERVRAMTETINNEEIEEPQEIEIEAVVDHDQTIQ